MPVKAESLKEKPKKFDGFWVSSSKIKCFKTCPAQYRYSYIEKLPQKTWAHSVYGKFMHLVLESFDKARLAGNKEPDHVLLTNCFKQALEKYNSLSLEYKQKGYADMGIYLQRLAQNKTSGKSPQILNAEEPFYLIINDEILLNGFIDLVQIDPDGIFHVADYKTSKSKSFLKKDYFQLLVYAYIKCIENPNLEIIRASYIMLSHEFEYMTKEFKRKDVFKIEKDIIDYVEEMKAEKLFRPNVSKLCEYCSFIDHCDAGKDYVKDNVKFGEQKWS